IPTDPVETVESRVSRQAFLATGPNDQSPMSQSSQTSPQTQWRLWSPESLDRQTHPGPRPRPYAH
ncbi:hypothetical protein SARC_15979, partial [Sphaeroforma arctica JP610]